MVLSRLRVLVFPETLRWWTARSLEHDIAAAAKTPEAALDAVVKIAQAHIAFDVRHGREPLSAFAPAPRPYWKAFAEATRISLEMDLQAGGDGAPIRVIVARVPQHPVVSAHTTPGSRDAVAAPLERLSNLFLGAHHDAGHGVVADDFDDARRYRRAVSGAGM